MGQFDVEFLRKYIDIKKYPCVVETGTLYGDSAMRISEEFPEVHTIEIHPTLFARASQRFAARPSVTCHFGDSASVLPKLLPKLQSPTIFYLDAHWSGDHTTNWGASNWKGYGNDTGYRVTGPIAGNPASRDQVPLEEEIDCIVREFPLECIVYIDDMDKFDEHGKGLRNKGFHGEDWSHLDFESILTRIGTRKDFIHRSEYQCVIGIKAA